MADLRGEAYDAGYREGYRAARREAEQEIKSLRKIIKEENAALYQPVRPSSVQGRPNAN